MFWVAARFVEVSDVSIRFQAPIESNLGVPACKQSRNPAVSCVDGSHADVSRHNRMVGRTSRVDHVDGALDRAGSGGSVEICPRFEADCVQMVSERVRVLHQPFVEHDNGGRMILNVEKRDVIFNGQAVKPIVDVLLCRGSVHKVIFLVGLVNRHLRVLLQFMLGWKPNSLT